MNNIVHYIDIGREECSCLQYIHLAEYFNIECYCRPCKIGTGAKEFKFLFKSLFRSLSVYQFLLTFDQCKRFSFE